MRTRHILLFIVTVVVIALFSCKKEEIKVAKTAQHNSEQSSTNDTIPPDPHLPFDDPSKHAGTQDDPYPIYSDVHWRDYVVAFAKDSNKYFRLTRSLTVIESCDTFRGHLDGNQQVVTVGNGNSVFKVIDGGSVQRLVVSGYINQLSNATLTSRVNQAGVTQRFFGALAMVVQGNAHIFDCRCVANYMLNNQVSCHLGGMVGLLKHSTIDGCSYGGNMIYEQGFMGGIASIVEDTSLLINSGVTGSLSGQVNMQIGGITRLAEKSTIVNSFVRCNITIDSSHNVDAAGLVLNSRGCVIDNCYYYGNLPSGHAVALCYSMSINTMLSYCYGLMSDNVSLYGNAVNGSVAENCIALVDGITLAEIGLAGNKNLVDQLNSRASYKGYLQWSIQNGIPQPVK